MALTYLTILGLALAPGLPLGFAIFGRAHPLGWVAGALLGYLMTAIALSVPMSLGVSSAAALLGSWLLTLIAGYLLARPLSKNPLRPSLWTWPDSQALALTVCITLAIAVPPIMRVGSIDSFGNRYYRAYFTADFVWHMALASELSKFSWPPRNPYLASQHIHYYWSYFVLPAAATARVPKLAAASDSIQTCLKINALVTAVLFTSTIFLLAWIAIPRAHAVALSVTAAIVASSGEGLYALVTLWRSKQPLGAVANLNIDAISSWWFSGLRIDGLPRCFWWVPQHSMAYSLGMLALILLNNGKNINHGATLMAGLALGGSLIMNPFVGGVFCVVWSCISLLSAPRTIYEFIRWAGFHLATALPVMVGLFWCVHAQMTGGGLEALQYGLRGDARQAPIFNLLLSLGPIVGLTVACVFARPGLRTPVSKAAALLSFIAIAVMHLLRLKTDASWVGFRAGQLLLIGLPPLIAQGLSVSGRKRTLIRLILAATLFAGMPTTAIDFYNAQDISNKTMSPIGPWTLTVTRHQWEGVEWLRRQTPPDAIVQMEIVARGRANWSFIPSFGQRRMAAGMPISLLLDSEYTERTLLVHNMFATTDSLAAWHIARQLSIDYIWTDDLDRRNEPSGTRKFGTGARLFQPVFWNSDVVIYAVR